MTHDHNKTSFSMNPMEKLFHATDHAADKRIWHEY